MALISKAKTDSICFLSSNTRARTKIRALFFKSKIKKRMVFTYNKRRALVESVLAMGRDLMEQVVTIVKPKTILAWQRKLEKQKLDYSDRRKNNLGRPWISLDIEQLVCRMAHENEWGYERIQGELKKLDIEISKNSVANILRRMGCHPHLREKGCHSGNFWPDMHLFFFVLICSRKKSGLLEA